MGEAFADEGVQVDLEDLAGEPAFPAGRRVPLTRYLRNRFFLHPGHHRNQLYQPGMQLRVLLESPRFNRQVRACVLGNTYLVETASVYRIWATALNTA